MPRLPSLLLFLLLSHTSPPSSSSPSPTASLSFPYQTSTLLASPALSHPPPPTISLSPSRPPKFSLAHPHPNPLTTPSPVSVYFPSQQTPHACLPIHSSRKPCLPFPPYSDPLFPTTSFRQSSGQRAIIPVDLYTTRIHPWIIFIAPWINISALDVFTHANTVTDTCYHLKSHFTQPQTKCTHIHHTNSTHYADKKCTQYLSVFFSSLSFFWPPQQAKFTIGYFRAPWVTYFYISPSVLRSAKVF